MNDQKRKIINQIAELVRNQFSLTTPINMIDVVSSLGGEIIEAPFDNNTISGKIQKKGESFIIQINPFELEERKTFTLAHEIGHLFLHMGYLVNPEKWKSINIYEDSPMFRQGYSEEEYEANEFAAAFLMPFDEFKKAALNNLSINEIANKFQVSKEAALIRGRWLGCYGWN